MSDSTSANNSNSTNSRAIRTRFAPSPTGRVHIGSVQKILYSYACARWGKGSYVLRIEDTDQSRYVEGAEEEIERAHELLGLTIDESPTKGGQFGPYRQSERLNIYQEYVAELIAAGHAYYAFDTPEELAQMRELQQAAGQRPRYNGRDRELDPEEAAKRVAAGEAHVVRTKLPAEPREVGFTDLIMGEIKVSTEDLDDYVLVKSDGFPTYHLAVVVDDHQMQISHVFRGVEWIPTAPIHVLLYEYFGWEAPQFAHVPNLLDPKGGKLSKRSGSVALLDYFAEGFLPEAISNYLLLRGWSNKSDEPGAEFIDVDYLIENFDFANFTKSNPVFDRQKLTWFNEHYIREQTPVELTETALNWALQQQPEVAEFWEQLDRHQLTDAIALEQERVSLLSELPAKIETFFTSAPDLEFDWDHKQVRRIDRDLKRELLTDYLNRVGDEPLAQDDWEPIVRSLAQARDLGAGKVFMLLRIAITGKSATPPLTEFIAVIGWQEHLARVKAALDDLMKS